MFIRKWRLKLVVGITIISMLPALALALSYSDLTSAVNIPYSPGGVLGESAYNSVTITSPTNKTLLVSVTPKYFDQSRGKNGEWLYEITWKRTLQRDGSLRVYPKNKTGNKLLAVNTKPAGSEQFYAPPLTSIRVNFYSQTDGRGTLLLGKYFTTLKAETADLGNLGGGVGMANPASVNCVSNGGKLVMRSGTDGGQSGYCVFPDGQECEEWAFYNGVCGPKNTLVCPKAALSICPDGSVPNQVPGTCNYTCPTTKTCKPRPVCLNTPDGLRTECNYPEPSEGWCKPLPASSSLKSKFLKDDLTAQKIFNGSLTDYSITNFQLGSSSGSAPTTSFAYRLVSSLRQLGYSESMLRLPGSNVGQFRLNKFQRLNNLPKSDIVTKDVLALIDSKLAASEILDEQVGKTFPLYGRLMAPPNNEPSKEHLARILSLAFKALPSNLNIWSENEFKNYFYYQLPNSIKFANNIPDYFNGDFIVCPEYYPEVDIRCVFKGDTADVLLFRDDVMLLNTVLHEYAHYLDKNLYYTQDGLSRGIIDTKEFYALSYNLLATPHQGNGHKYYPLLNTVNPAKDFVSGYAVGNQIDNEWGFYTTNEDFAESFALYMMSGKVFREMTKNSPVLRDKYNWLRQNVFSGKEYNTGDDQSLAIMKQNPAHAEGGNIASNSSDFVNINTNFVWSYNFPEYRP